MIVVVTLDVTGVGTSVELTCAVLAIDPFDFVVLNTPDAPEITSTTISGPVAMPQSIVGMSVSSEPEFSPNDPRRPYTPE